MNLRRRLENVTERAVLFQIIKDVMNDPESNGDVVEAFCESMDCFSKFLTDKEYTTALSPIIDKQCPIRSIIGLGKGLPTVSAMDTPTTFRDVMTVLGWVKQVAEHLPRVILDSITVRETDAETTQLFRDFAKAAMSLPDKMSNCTAKALTEDHIKYIDTVKWSFKKNVLSGMQEAMRIAHKKPASNLKTVSELLSAGRNMEVTSRHVLLGNIMEWIGSMENFDDRWTEIMCFMFREPTVLGVQVHEALLTSVFLSAKNEQTLTRCIHPTTLSGTLRRVVMVKLPFQRVLKPRTIRIVIDFVHKTGEAYGMELLETALKIWADSMFAKKAPEPQERHLVRIIVYSIHRFRKSGAEIPWNELFLISMNGVHSRMGMLPIYVQSALFVNSTLSAIATKEEDAPEPPKAENSTWIQELEAILEQGIEKRGKSEVIAKKEDSDDDEFTERIGERRNSEEDLRQPLLQKDSDSEEEILPPSRLNSSPLPSAAPIDSDDDEEFPVYQLDASESKFRNLEPGEEPRSKIPPPSYIVDAYEWLLEKENPEIFEAAFFHLKSLIDRRAIGFTQIAEKLFVRVVHLQNSFGTRNFDETVDKIATACITQRPEIVPALVRLLIAPGQAYPIQHRLLQCIHKAADEMGALDKRNEQFVTEQELRVGGMTMDHVQQEPEDEEIAGLRAMFDIRIPEARIEAEARILANTRRFGTSARERPRAGVVNRLAKAAKYMFYPLLVTPRGENARLLSKDADLLAYIIMVASMIYVRCGVNPAVAKMTTELIAYAAPHRYSENAKLRTACMAAYLNVLALIPGNMLAELFPIEERQEWLEWLNAVQMNPETQQMEHNMGHQMHSIIEENIEQFNPIAFYQSRHLY